jgi:hypothetical protein
MNGVAKKWQNYKKLTANTNVPPIKISVSFCLAIRQFLAVI